VTRPTTASEERIGTTVRSSRGRDGLPHAYEVRRLLGTSSTSAVYEAVREDERRYALKILHASLCRDRSVVQRFLREAYVANTIKHPSIVGVHDDGVADGSAFLVLDLLQGETLEERRLRRGGKLPPPEVLPLAGELMSALAAVHAAGVVHRDVKPHNVFLTDHDGLKLLDFGTARIFNVEGGVEGNESVSVEGLVIGTPSFMSPEQACGERDGIDARADVWSLGATLFMTLSGEYVHPGRDAHQRILATATRPARSLATVAPELAVPVIDLVDRALAFDRDRRWPDMAAMQEALASLL
jgi:serine/threonine-protein kinase